MIAAAADVVNCSFDVEKEAIKWERERERVLTAFKLIRKGAKEAWRANTKVLA